MLKINCIEEPANALCFGTVAQLPISDDDHRKITLRNVRGLLRA